MIKIPLFTVTSAHFTQRIELNSHIIVLRIWYNTRSEYFYLTITTESGEQITNTKIVPHWLLLKQSIELLSDFEGDFIAIKDTEEAVNKITYDNFGTAYNLYYLTPADVEQWEVDNGIQT